MGTIASGGGGSFAPRREILLPAVEVVLLFASGGVLSFNSERKYPKNATKTYGFGILWRAGVGVDLQKMLAGGVVRCRCRAEGLCRDSFPLPLR